MKFVKDLKGRKYNLAMSTLESDVTAEKSEGESFLEASFQQVFQFKLPNGVRLNADPNFKSFIRTLKTFIRIRPIFVQTNYKDLKDFL